VSEIHRKPAGKIRHSYVATNVTTSAWVQISASIPATASSVQIFDSSGKIIKLSTGTAGNEDASELNYYIFPGGADGVLRIPFTVGDRLSAKAVDNTAQYGDLILNFFV